MSKKQIDMLKDMPLFYDFSAGGLKKFLKTSKYISCRKGDIIFEEDAEEDSFFIVAEGLVAIEKKTDRTGKRFKRLAILKKNDFFGEMAVIERQPRFAQARAMKDSGLFELSRDNLMSFIKNCPEDGTSLLIEIIRVVLKRLKSTSDELMMVQGFIEVLAKRKRN